MVMVNEKHTHPPTARALLSKGFSEALWPLAEGPVRWRSRRYAVFTVWAKPSRPCSGLAGPNSSNTPTAYGAVRSICQTVNIF